MFQWYSSISIHRLLPLNDVFIGAGVVPPSRQPMSIEKLKVRLVEVGALDSLKIMVLSSDHKVLYRFNHYSLCSHYCNVVVIVYKNTDASGEIIGNGIVM